MEINQEIYEVLKQHKIDRDSGVLALLAVYFKLDAEKVVPEVILKAINLTKIVDKDYRNNSIKWNMPLFIGQETDWEWVKAWNNKWNANMSRKASNPDCIKRMQEFFRKYPKYRIDDVMKATEMYMREAKPEYYKNSAAFIFDGAGVNKKSILLGWCEKLTDKPLINTMQKGELLK